ncbi:5'-3' exonuclease [Sporosarcina highlanderae]|uniref:5'-3' exonuclease n=1 Tax=Sporosarcina highlanderae TaxID=3035916 RepID=A0ABT8JUJ0_9BACL|nr:5'-3' exonuclease H3TH domain-containing protein [Sporosarcina highlanderae]MDN4608805.1 5'-3' exonuclease H3TH domain-containing protein [Sporosarcina highlanderae]
MENKPHILLIDGMAVLFRSFFATSAMGHFFPNADGVPTNGVQGFGRHALTAASIFNPTHLAVCWDMSAHTFRNDLFDGYKANRPAPAPELLPQFDMTRDLSELIGWKNYGIQGMEADDLIGSLVCEWEGKADITIVTGDKDLLQLLRPGVKIAFMKKGYNIYDIYDEQRFIEEYEIPPHRFVEIKAFTGDASDGYPGVKGIGPKTALKLIKEYETVEKVVESLHELAPGMRKKIEADMEMLHLSKQLAQIHCEIDFEDPIEELILPEFSSSELRDQLEQHGYSMILRQLNSLFPEQTKTTV